MRKQWKEIVKQRSSSGNQQVKLRKKIPMENDYEMLVLEQENLTQKESKKSVDKKLEIRKQFSHIKSGFAEQVHDILFKAQQSGQERDFKTMFKQKAYNETQQIFQSQNTSHQTLQDIQRTKGSNKFQKITKGQTQEATIDVNEIVNSQEFMPISPMTQLQQMEEMQQGPRLCLKSVAKGSVDFTEDINSNARQLARNQAGIQQDLSHIKLINPNSIFNNFEFFSDFIAGKIDNKTMLDKIKQDLGENIIQDAAQKKYININENEENFRLSASNLYPVFHSETMKRQSQQTQDWAVSSIEGQQEIPSQMIQKQKMQKESEDSEESSVVSFAKEKPEQPDLDQDTESDDETPVPGVAKMATQNYGGKNQARRDNSEKIPPSISQQFRKEEHHNQYDKQVKNENKQKQNIPVLQKNSQSTGWLVNSQPKQIQGNSKNKQQIPENPINLPNMQQLQFVRQQTQTKIKTSGSQQNNQSEDRK